eukprot:6468972-Amphidinium_carterae.1
MQHLLVEHVAQRPKQIERGLVLQQQPAREPRKSTICSIFSHCSMRTCDMAGVRSEAACGCWRSALGALSGSWQELALDMPIAFPNKRVYPILWRHQRTRLASLGSLSGALNQGGCRLRSGNCLAMKRLWFLTHALLRCSFHAGRATPGAQ